jgi:predicted transposase YbfD/YdcC
LPQLSAGGGPCDGWRDHCRGRRERPQLTGSPPCSALHRVSAWACSTRLVLGQEATAEKSNEISAIPKLLALPELKGSIVTIDAMGCQRAIAEQIIAQGGDSVLGLKGNQRALQEGVEDFFNGASAGTFAGVAHDFHEEIDKDHGRLEVRRYWITEDLRTLPDHPLWARLRRIGLGRAPLHHGHRRDRGAALLHQLHPRSSQNHRPCGARPLGDGEPPALAPRRALPGGRQPHPQRQRARHHDGHPPLSRNLREHEPSPPRLSQKRRTAAWNDDYRAKVVFGQ